MSEPVSGIEPGQRQSNGPQTSGLMLPILTPSVFKVRQL
jgi:hypothetical protein